MKKINFEDLPSTNTSIDSTNMNLLQNNVEESVVYIGSSQPLTNEKVWFKKSKNLFDKNYKFKNLTILADGTFEQDSSASINVVKVNPGSTYTISSNVSRQWVISTGKIIPIDGGKTTKKEVVTGKTITRTIPIDDNYLYIREYLSSSEDNTTQNVQVELGNTETTYEAYIEPKIMVKNDSGIFEEFIRKNETIYSTSEQKIGTWINGKPLYRNIIEFDITNTNGYNTQPIDLNIDELCKYDGYIIEANGSIHKLNYVNQPSAMYIRLAISPSAVNVITTKATSFKNSNCRAIIEYTKK